MRKTFYYLFIFLILGLAGGGLRAYELRYAFDGVLGLPARNHPLSLMLLALCVLTVLLAIGCSRGFLPAHFAPQPGAPVMRRALTIAAVNSLLLLVSAVLGFRDAVSSFSLTQLILAPLAVISAVTLLLAIRSLCRESSGSLGGLYATIPIFWACFWLMLFFKDHASDPVILNYAYELLSVVFLILALYLSAGSFFGNRGRRRLLFFCLLGIFFNMMCLLAPLCQQLLFTDYPYRALMVPADLARHLFAVSHLFLLYWLTRHHQTMFVQSS